MYRKSGLYAQHNLDAESIVFSLFTPDDIKKLCITKIITSLSFDGMGYPLVGGLYDKALGPLTEKSDPCSTCKKNYNDCPGHFGYIDLPLPVINPLFHKIIQSILKVTCLSCFRMQVSDNVKRLISAHMHFLDCGMVTEAKEIETLLDDIVDSEKKDISEDVTKRIKKLLKIAKSVGTTDIVLNKTTETLRNKFLHGILKLSSGKKKCMHCKSKFEKIQSFRTKLMRNIKKLDDSETNMESPTKAKGDIKIISADELRVYLRNLWQNEQPLILEIVPVLKGVNMVYPTDVFFWETVAVSPVNVRPVSYVNGMATEHARTQTYKSILEICLVLRAVIQVVQGGELPESAKAVYATSIGQTAAEKLHALWEDLQGAVDALADHELAPKGRSSQGTTGQGLKQLIEKKAGIIRMHMMGKRVNFAARSVITPDPNLGIDEIGIPEEFAKQLTYPVPVTPWNVEELRKAVLNGPRVHPGASMVEFGGKTQRINPLNKVQQESILKRLLTPEDDDKSSVKIVHRHLQNGDVLLLNRQPTLHRPSIMAHTARILRGEKTIRLHYANCKAYNADFDGDEMNAHFPQNELARSEGYTLANVSSQYLVPKDGTPLAGLIQDHVIAGVRISVRGRFFTQSDYHQLVWSAIGNGQIKLLPPAIIQPVKLWSGKQVLSTLILNVLPVDRPAVNLTATAKIPARAWGSINSPKYMSEHEVIIRGGELLCGVLDKAHYGATPYGLVHCVYELYGGACATRLLTCLARLFTHYLQIDGFTLGVRDILVLDKADKERRHIIKESRKIGPRVAALAVDVDPETTNSEELSELIDRAHASNPKFRDHLDRQYKQALDSYTNDVNRTCVPAGLLSQFPENNLQLMVLSGAKGSTVNTMQISCLLGQIELEGRRPPKTVSGRALPSFPPHDTQPRAGGFIDGRFMTGIQPQEFFFHCMAGREGLIDTAVKTSRSGYLQRCLVKHLEGLKVAYDLTVRDSDNSVVQFLYGEDGMDVCRAQFLSSKQLPFLKDNVRAIIEPKVLEKLKDTPDFDKVKQHLKKVKKWRKSNQCKNISAFSLFSEVMTQKLDIDEPDKINPKTGRTNLTQTIIDLWREANDEIKSNFKKRCEKSPDPVNACYQPDHYFGALPERLQSLIESDVNEALQLKAMQSLAAPGEPVGLLAAQSVGEPSTQMTLNTFHFAGRGEMNVTLGIPRLREILMMASANIKTPSMEVPFLPVDNLKIKSECLRRSLTRVTVANVLERIDVSSRLQIKPTRKHAYTLTFRFLPFDLYRDQYDVTPRQILKHMTKKFFGHMFTSIRRITKISTGAVLINEEKKKVKKKKDEEGEGEPDDLSSSEEEPEGAEEDAKINHKFHDKQEDQEPSDSEIDNSESETETEVKIKPDETETAVIDAYSYAESYRYDRDNHTWCELTFCLPMQCGSVDLTGILKDAAEKSVIRETENIRRAITYVRDDGSLVLRTDGINVQEMFRHHGLLDLNRLYCNDIHRVGETYGIEAARRVIVKEVQDVFNVYGITVDPRHLLLIADYMCYNGAFEPLSRRGMEGGTSPLQQMSFEASLGFLREAALRGKSDGLSSPSGRLMLGKPCAAGTGSFTLRHKIAAFVN